MRKAKQPFIPAPDPLDYPKYFKNGSRFVRVESKNKATEVQLMKTGTTIKTEIRKVANLHIVEEASALFPSDRETFDAAFRNALEKLQEQ